MMPPFKIGETMVGGDNPCYIIAEIGMTHFGDTKIVRNIIQSLAGSGANAIKTQMINVDACYADDSEWKDRLRGRALSLSQLAAVKEAANDANMDFFATPHDEAVLPWVTELRMPCVKIGSGEVGNPAFVKRAAELGKPMLVSLGMHMAVDRFEASEACAPNPTVLMHCVSKYPTDLTEASLGGIKDIEELDTTHVGYSDHTIGHIAGVMAIALGAKVIEKHVTSSYGVGRDDANDWRVATPAGLFGAFVNDIRMAEAAMHQRPKYSLDGFRKSLTTTKKIEKGIFLARTDLTAKRPGTGIAPRDWSMVVGKRVKRTLEPNTTLTWDDIQNAPHSD